MYKEMMLAIMNGDRDKIKRFISDSKNDINIRDKNKRTLLMEAVIFKNEEIAKLLIENEADINAREIKGWTALHFAVQSYLTDIVKLLIAKGADVNAQDDYGNTPLLNALGSFDGHRKDVIVLLLSSGANKDLANKSGISSYQFAMKVTNHDLKQFFN